jgi:transposase
LKKPIDIDGVLTHLRNLLDQNRSEEALAQIGVLLEKMNEQNTELGLRLAKALRRQFGRRSEKISAEQLSLFLLKVGENSAAKVEPSSFPTAPTNRPQPAPKPAPRPHGRRSFSANLERRKETIPVPEHERTCFCCNMPKAPAGEEVSTVLDYEPGRFFVREIHREKLACRPCGDGMVVAPVASKVIEAGLAGTGLMAHILISKYKDAIPLHRMRGIFRRGGVQLAVSTLADWVAQAAALLEPIADEIFRQAMHSYLLQTDDTGLKVLDRDHPAGIRRGHVWIYVGDAKWAAFVFTPNWSSEGPLAHMINRVGPVLHDGYAGYEAFHKNRPDRPEFGCWSHARRGFEESVDGGDSRAAVPLALIGKLFEVERLANEDRVDLQERLHRRLVYSKPILDELERWMRGTLLCEPPKSTLAKAIGYIINRRDALCRFLDDPRFPLENNLCERLLRSIAVGRNNYLFAGSDEGAKNAAIVYSIIATCTLNDVEPWAYLNDLLAKLAAGWPNSRLADLLPINWKAAQQQTQQESSAAASAV